MHKQCQHTLQQLERWLELNRQEKQAVLEHAWHCAACGKALSAMRPVLSSLDRSVDAYNRIKFPGRMPPLPQQKPLRNRFSLSAPALGWSAVAMMLIFVMVWFAGQRPAGLHLADRQSVSQIPRIPSMPKRPPNMSAISINPGSVSHRLPKLERKLTPLLRRHLKMPGKPKTSKPDAQKEIGMIPTHHV